MPDTVKFGTDSNVPSKVKFALLVRAVAPVFVNSILLAVYDEGTSVSAKNVVAPPPPPVIPNELVATHVGNPPTTCNTCPVVPIALWARVFAPEANSRSPVVYDDNPVPPLTVPRAWARVRLVMVEVASVEVPNTLIVPPTVRRLLDEVVPILTLPFEKIRIRSFKTLLPRVEKNKSWFPLDCILLSIPTDCTLLLRNESSIPDPTTAELLVRDIEAVDPFNTEYCRLPLVLKPNDVVFPPAGAITRPFNAKSPPSPIASVPYFVVVPIPTNELVVSTNKFGTLLVPTLSPPHISSLLAGDVVPMPTFLL